MAFPSPFCDVSFIGPSGNAGPGINAVRPFRVHTPGAGPLLPPMPTPGSGDGGCGCGPNSGAMVQGGCGGCGDGGGITPQIQ